MNKKERAAYRRGLTDGARFVIEHERLHRVVAQALADLKDTGMAIIEPLDEQYVPKAAQQAVYDALMKTGKL